MPTRTVAQATAELRLSDKQADADLRSAIARLQQRLTLAERRLGLNIPVGLDTKRFDAELAALTTRLPQQLSVGLSVDTSNIDTVLAAARTPAPVVLPVTGDLDPFEAQLAGLEAQARATSVEVPVGLDTSRARTQFLAFQSVMDQLGGDVVRDFRSQGIEDARSSLQRLATLAASIRDQRIQIDPELRDTAVRAELARLATVLSQLDGREVNIPIDIGAEEALRLLPELQAEVEALDGRQIDLRVDVEGLQRARAEIEATDQTAARAADERSGGIGRMAVRLGFLGVGGAVALGALGGAITTFGVKSAAALEATQFSFQNILGSADEAKQLFTELQAFSIPSPFNTQTLADTAKQLLAIGTSVDEVVPTVKDLAAIVALLAGGSNEAFGRITLAFGQIQSSVKPFAQDVRQITQALPGFNAQMQLATGVAEKFGVDIAGAQKLIEDGAVTGADAVQILLERMREFPGVAGSIEASAQTLPGKLAAFTDTIKLSLVNAFKELPKTIGDTLVGLEDPIDAALKRIAPALAKSVEGLIPDIEPLVDRLGQRLPGAFEGLFTGLQGAIAGATPVLDELLNIAEELGPIVGDILQQIGPAAAESAHDIATIVVPALAAFSDVLDSIDPHVLSVLLTTFIGFKALGGIGSGLRNISAGIQGSVLSLERFGKTQQQIEEATAQTSRGIGGIGTAASAAGSLAVGAFSGMALAAEDTTTKIVGLAGAVGSIAAGFATGPITGAAAVVGVAVGAIIGHFAQGKQAAKDFATEVDRLADSLEGLSREDATQKLVDDLKDKLGKVSAELEDGGFLQGLDLAAIVEQRLTDGNIDLQPILDTIFGNLKIDPNLFDQITVAAKNADVEVTDIFSNTGKVLDSLRIQNFGLEQLPVLDDAQQRQKANLEALIGLLESYQNQLDDSGVSAKDVGKIINELTSATSGFNKSLDQAAIRDSWNTTVAGADDAAESIAAARNQLSTYLSFLRDRANEADTFWARQQTGASDFTDLLKSEIAQAQAALDQFQSATQTELNQIGLDTDRQKMARDLAEFTGEYKKLEQASKASNTRAKQRVDDLKGSLDDATASAEKALQALTDFIVGPTQTSAAAKVNKAVGQVGDVGSNIEDALRVGGVRGEAAISDALSGLDSTISDIIQTGLKEGISTPQEFAQLLAPLSTAINEEIGDLGKRLLSSSDFTEGFTPAAGERIRAELDRILNPGDLGARLSAVVNADLNTSRLQSQLDSAQKELDDIEVTPTITVDPQDLHAELIAAAKQAGVPLSVFIRTDTSDIALQGNAELSNLVKESLGLINDAFNDNTLTKDQANDKAAAVTENLRKALASEFDPKTAQDIIDRYFPLADWRKMGKDAAAEAAQAAAVELATTGKLEQTLKFHPELSEVLTAMANLDKTVDIELVPNVDEFDRLIRESLTQLQTDFPFLVQVGLAAPQLGRTRIFQSREGNIFEDHSPQVTRSIRVFGEPETEGEAYIPFSRRYRTRAEGLLDDVAGRFGFDLVPQSKTDGAINVPMAPPPSSGLAGQDLVAAIAEGMRRAQASTLFDRAGEFADAVHIDRIDLGGEPNAARQVDKFLDQLAMAKSGFASSRKRRPGR